MSRPGGARLLLAFLAATSALPGVWATVAPRSFYRGFPGGGRDWVTLAGPYSGHLTADVGAFYVAFTVLFAWAAARPQRALVLPLSVAWMAFSALHAGWHLTHLHGFGMGDAIGQTASLLAVLAAPVAVLVLVGADAQRRSRPAT